MDRSLDERRAEEFLDVVARRYTEARFAGLEHMDAIRFARSSEDIGLLRQLVRGGAPPDLVARIVL